MNSGLELVTVVMWRRAGAQVIIVAGGFWGSGCFGFAAGGVVVVAG